MAFARFPVLYTDQDETLTNQHHTVVWDCEAVARTATLPATIEDGMIFTLKIENKGVNKLTVDRNGNLIEGNATDLQLKWGDSITLIGHPTKGWVEINGGAI